MVWFLLYYIFFPLKTLPLEKGKNLIIRRKEKKKERTKDESSRTRKDPQLFKFLKILINGSILY